MATREDVHPAILESLIMREVKHALTDSILENMRDDVERELQKYLDEIQIHVEKYLTPERFGETIKVVLDDRREKILGKNPPNYSRSSRQA